MDVTFNHSKRFVTYLNHRLYLVINERTKDSSTIVFAFVLSKQAFINYLIGYSS